MMGILPVLIIVYIAGALTGGYVWGKVSKNLK